MDMTTKEEDALVMEQEKTEKPTKLNDAPAHLTCTYCDSVFPSTDDLITHMREVHVKIDANVKSEKELVKESTEQQTISEVNAHENHRMTFMCGRCFFNTYSQGSLDYHIARRHIVEQNDSCKRIIIKRRAWNLEASRRFRERRKDKRRAESQEEEMHAKRNRELKLKVKDMEDRVRMMKNLMEEEGLLSKICKPELKAISK